MNHNDLVREKIQYQQVPLASSPISLNSHYTYSQVKSSPTLLSQNHTYAMRRLSLVVCSVAAALATQANALPAPIPVEITSGGMGAASEQPQVQRRSLPLPMANMAKVRRSPFPSGSILLYLLLVNSEAQSLDLQMKRSSYFFTALHVS